MILLPTYTLTVRTPASPEQVVKAIEVGTCAANAPLDATVRGRWFSVRGRGWAGAGRPPAEFRGTVEPTEAGSVVRLRMMPSPLGAIVGGAILGLYLLFGLVAVAIGLGSASEAALAIGLAVVGLWVVIYTLTVVGIRLQAAYIRRRLVPLIEHAADPAVRSGEAFIPHPAPDRAWP